MSVTSFEDVKGHEGRNVRKALELSILVKPWVKNDDEIETVWTAAAGLIIPTGYKPVGMTTKDDGASWSRDQDTADVEAHGYSEPVRRDITSDVSGLSFTMIESNLKSMEIFHGLDLSGVTTDSDGNFFFDKASRPVQRHYRVLAIGKDGDGSDAIYVARWLPYAQVTESGEQAWSEGTEIRYPATFTAYYDADIGTALREVWGGPGLDHEAMGFPSATPAE